MMGLFSALVCVATIILKVDIPQTKGYFNVGDSMVFLTALLLGPRVGGLAGGLGSMLADVILGAPWYAPGTFVIKGIEGFVAGKISKRRQPLKDEAVAWKLVVVSCGIFVAMVLYFLGSTYYSAEWQFSPLNMFVMSFEITAFIWLAISVLVAALFAFAAFKLDLNFGWPLLSCMAGGFFMVLGYFVYEYSVLGLGLLAAYEIPFNLGQVIVGSLIALPLYRALSKREHLSTN
jgi:uncharacterized membrane protein